MIEFTPLKNLDPENESMWLVIFEDSSTSTCYYTLRYGWTYLDFSPLHLEIKAATPILIKEVTYPYAVGELAKFEDEVVMVLEIIETMDEVKIHHQGELKIVATDEVGALSEIEKQRYCNRLMK